MKPVYVCQLTQGEQQAIQNMLTGLILHGCGGDPVKVQEYYGIPLEEAVQNGMDSKIVDLDYLMTFYTEEYETSDADKQFHLEDATTISHILREGKRHETENELFYPLSESNLEDEEDLER